MGYIFQLDIGVSDPPSIGTGWRTVYPVYTVAFARITYIKLNRPGHALLHPHLPVVPYKKSA